MSLKEAAVKGTNRSRGSVMSSGGIAAHAANWTVSYCARMAEETVLGYRKRRAKGCVGGNLADASACMQARESQGRAEVDGRTTWGLAARVTLLSPCSRVLHSNSGIRSAGSLPGVARSLILPRFTC